jgi:hypothetical protein
MMPVQDRAEAQRGRGGGHLTTTDLLEILVALGGGTDAGVAQCTVRQLREAIRDIIYADPFGAPSPPRSPTAASAEAAAAMDDDEVMCIHEEHLAEASFEPVFSLDELEEACRGIEEPYSPVACGDTVPPTKVCPTLQSTGPQNGCLDADRDGASDEEARHVQLYHTEQE